MDDSRGVSELPSEVWGVLGRVWACLPDPTLLLESEPDGVFFFFFSNHWNRQLTPLCCLEVPISTSHIKAKRRVEMEGGGAGLWPRAAACLWLCQDPLSAHVNTRNYYHAAKECEDLPDRGSSQSHSCSSCSCSCSYETQHKKTDKKSMLTRHLKWCRVLKLVIVWSYNKEKCAFKKQVTTLWHVNTVCLLRKWVYISLKCFFYIRKKN